MSSANSIQRPFSGPNKPTFSCQKCGITVGFKKNLYAHMRKFHPEDVVISNNQVCGLCKETFHTIVNLHEHLQKRHEVKLNFSSETFYSEEDFLKWKEKIELASRSSFFLRNTSQKVGVKFSYYVCHRSGYSNPKLNRARHMKASGSVRCGCTCPAVINVSTHTVEEVKEITVHYQSVHVGHELEVGKLHLSETEKSSLASSLCLGIPMATILDKTREEYSSTKRFGLTTRKDLHNICRDKQIAK
ncbi:uncharacterized protein TNIN_420871 [Trichonephila inaurata madagascariensis]|uniref:C2H2-type domain-containing protein n=1 Tax=Trichonephila inaurata madagascariensis TaxID=2747483 RepID=A0A8X7CRX8_9ARAC|nr:uncharacterized protein TNIN_420871 [Trichonephila inaurata madagascariensis]